MTRTAGIDGCPAGWLRIEVPAPGRYDARVFTTAAQAFADAAEFALITIDIPIGLTDQGPRECDVEARRLIGPRRSSVFPAPVRAALDAETYEDASHASRVAHGKALSKQAFAILPKIRDVDAVLRADPALQARVREVHPEVCFHLWNDAVHLAHPKRRPEGFAERHRLVEAAFPGGYEHVRRQFARGAVANDDILDAFAALWAALRAVAGDCATLPAMPPRDRFGLPMEMLA